MTWVELSQKCKRSVMRYLVTVLLSAALIWCAQQETPVHKSHADKASVHRTTVAPKASTPTENSAVQPVKTPEPVATPEPAVEPVITYGTHEELMKSAGINPADYGAVDYIVSHESSWNPNATEPTLGAHGLIQALPYSKTGCGWSDEVCQLEWGTQYATTRYGGWQGAYLFWSSNRWW